MSIYYKNANAIFFEEKSGIEDARFLATPESAAILAPGMQCYFCNTTPY